MNPVVFLYGIVNPISFSLLDSGLFPLLSSEPHFIPFPLKTNSRNRMAAVSVGLLPNTWIWSEVLGFVMLGQRLPVGKAIEAPAVSGISLTLGLPCVLQARSIIPFRWGSQWM